MSNNRNKIILAFVLVATVIAIGAYVSQTRQQVSHAQLKVVAILPLTGPAATFGQDEKLGMDLAQQARKGGRVPMSFAFEDSQGKPDLAVSILRKSYDLGGSLVFFVSTTGPSMATLPILQESKDPSIAFVIATLSGMTKDFPSSLRVYPSVDEEIRALATYAKAMGYKRIAAYCVKNQAGEDFIRKMNEKAAEFGGSVVFSDTFPAGEKDYRQVLLKVKAANPDALLVTGYTGNYGDMFRQMLEGNFKIPVLTGGGLALGGLEKEFPADFMKNVVFPLSRFSFEKDTSRVHEFEALVKKSGKVPNFEIAYAYDSTCLLQAAVDRAGTTDTKAVFDAILSLMPYEGINGTIKLDQYRDAILDLRPCRYGPNGIERALPALP